MSYTAAPATSTATTAIETVAALDAGASSSRREPTTPASRAVLVQRARRILAVQTAAAIAVTILMVGVLALIVVTRSQHGATQALLRTGLTPSPTSISYGSSPT